MKKINYITIAVICGISSMAYATGGGFYLGAQGGATNTHNKDKLVQTGTIPATVLATPSGGGFGGRFFMGANMSQYAAIEAGITHYGTTTYNPSITVLCSKPTVKENAFDLVGKGMLPFANSGLDVFGKAGVAVISVGQSGSLRSLPSSNPCSSSSSNTTAVRPTGTLGVSYDITPSWVADVSWSRVFSGGGTVQNLDFLALGISYHFVDHYCGQFLC